MRWLGLSALLLVTLVQGADAGQRLRIVSLAPSLTELAYAAGAGDATVSYTHLTLPTTILV